MDEYYFRLPLQTSILGTGAEAVRGGKEETFFLDDTALSVERSRDSNGERTSSRKNVVRKRHQGRNPKEIDK